MDNLVKRVLPNSPNRDCFNYVQVVDKLYSTPFSSNKIRLFLKHHNEAIGSSIKINGLCHLLKYKEAVPHLLQLLQGGGGVWGGNCEAAYQALVRWKVEKVIYKL